MSLNPSNKDLVDIHSHLEYTEKGIFRIYNLSPGQSIENSAFSIALHPWNVSDYEGIDSFEERLTELASDERIVLIGESGLDKYRDQDYPKQMDIFKIHIKVSELLKKPLIIHCVRAFDDLMRIRKELRPKQKWIIHGFDSSPEMATQLVKNEIYLSIGERLLRKKAKSEMVMAVIPLSLLFLETDDSEIPLFDLYEIVAQYYNISVIELRDYILGNYKSLFKNG